jgi:hypothetical protein
MLNYMLRENADVANFIIIVSKNDAVMDKVLKQHMTHIDTHSTKSIINHHTSDD